MPSASIADLEGLTHRQRVFRLVELGRRAAQGDAAARAVIHELAMSADAYERLLAVRSVFGSRDGAMVLTAIRDPSRSVRQSAIALVALACTDAEAHEALAAIAGRTMLRRAIADLASARREAVVDAYLEGQLRAGATPAVLDLVPYGSAALVSRHLKALEQGGGDDCWVRIARRHALLMATFSRDEIARTNGIDARMRYRLYGRLPTLAERTPDAALAIIALLFERGEQPSALAGSLRPLVRRRPCETFDLLKQREVSGAATPPPGPFGVVVFDKGVTRLGPARLSHLIRFAWSALSDGKRGVTWFLRLSEPDRAVVLQTFRDSGRGAFGGFLFRYLQKEPAAERSKREAAFERWVRASQSASGTISVMALSFLPADLREREAHRHLSACPSLASKPAERLPYARLLPFAEARTVLAPFIGHPEGDERARANAILLASLHLDRSPEAMAAALAFVKQRKFEQDPVRQTLFGTLASLPIARFSAGDLPLLGECIQDALDAADLSHATSACVERLIVRLFRLDGAWGAEQLVRLLKVRGNAATWGLGDGLLPAEAERLVPALAGLAERWTTQERAGAVVSLAASLRLRLRLVPPLLVALERLARELPFAGVAAAALSLLREHDRPRFARLVPELLAADRSYALLPDVARHISLSRQDLLSPLLDDAPMKGRFATGRTLWVIDFDKGTGRWTSTQQKRYAAQLVKLLSDPEREIPTLRFAIGRLSRLAFADASSVLPFAADPRPPLREMAIRGLPWLDSRQGVPMLIDALGDDRARWAIYALRKVFSEMRPADVLVELRAVPQGKVTVAKEVVRLLGELGGPAAYEELLALEKKATHRDVRIAVLRALFDHLEDPRSWAVFERVVIDPDWVLASKLSDMPLGRLSDAAEARVLPLLEQVLGRKEPEARLEILTRAAYLPLRDTSRHLFRRLLAHAGTDAPEEAVLALRAALTRMYPTEVPDIVARLAELAVHQRKAATLVDALAAQIVPYVAKPVREVAWGLLPALRADVASGVLYLRLGARVWDYKKLYQALDDLSKSGLLYFDNLEAGIGAVRGTAHPASLEVLLGKHADPRMRRFGLAALSASAGPGDGWTYERRARLAHYRQDPSPSVAGPAAFVFPPEDHAKTVAQK